MLSRQLCTAILGFCKFPFCCYFTMSSFQADHISNLRKEYKLSGDRMVEDNLISKDPLCLFKHWFEIARSTLEIKEPNAMTIATVNKSGLPTARMVLLKNYNENGFTFFTNYRGAKAQDLAVVPYAALVFYWPTLCQSIRVEGIVEKVSDEVSDEYFSRRPRANQVGATASFHQSAPIEGVHVIEDRAAAIEKQFEGQPIPRPDYWGGYIVKPNKIEFWQGQSSRMSDRILFTKTDKPEELKFSKPGENGWVYQRLEP